MKRFNFSLKAVLVAFALSFSANVIADELPAEGVYYLYNATTGRFLNRGSWWGTRAVAANFGTPINVTIANGRYTLTNLDNNITYGDDYWMYGDAGGDRARSFAVEAVDGGYKLVSQLNQYVYINTWSDYDTDYGVAGNAAEQGDNCPEGNTIWQFLTADEYKAMIASRKAAWDAAAYESAGITAEDIENGFYEFSEYSVDGLSLTNGLGGWQWAAVRNGSGYATNANGTEVYQGTGIFSQTLTDLEPGLYRVNVQGFYRNGWNPACVTRYTAGYDMVPAYLNANGTLVQLTDWAADRADDGNPNSMTQAKALFDTGAYVSSALVYVDGDLDLSIVSPSFNDGGWLILSGVTVERCKAYTFIGTPEFSMEDGASVDADEISTVSITFPEAGSVKEGVTYSYTVVVTEDGEEVQTISGTFVPSEGIEVEIDATVGKTYQIILPQGTLTATDAAGKELSSNEEDITVTFETLTMTELAKKEYAETLAEAYAHLREAQTHKGVGLQLYLPSQVTRYAEALEAVAELGEDYVIYNDYVEGTELLKALIRELQPQRPKLNQRYILTQKSSGLKLNADNGVALAGVGTPVQFHHADGDVYYVYSTPDREYIGYTNANTWTLTNDASIYDKKLGKFALKHNHDTQAYNLVGIYGAIGSDKTESGSSLYGNKKEDAVNSQWLIEEYVEPVVADDGLAPGEYYIRNVATGKFLGGANSWGTKASIIEHGIDIKVAIADGLYTLDTKISNGGNSHFLGNGGYVDAASYGFNIVKVSKYYWEIEDPATGNVYSANADNTSVDLVTENGNYSYWEFLTKDELLEELAEGYTNDATFLIQDPNFGRNDQRQSAWTMSSDCTNQNLSGGDNENNCAESYHSTFTLSQTLDVPNGNYVVKCQGFYRIDDNNTDEHAVLYANDEKATLMNIVEGATAESIYTTEAWDTDTKRDEGYVPNSMAGSSKRFTLGMYADNEVPVTVTSGKLTIGIQCTQTHDWVIWDNFELFTVTDTEMAIYKARNDAAAEEATAINSVSETTAPVSIFSVNGAKLNSLQKGINIVKMSDGSFKKVLVK